VSKEGLELEETEEEKKAREEEAAQFNELCMTVKDVLGNKVEKGIIVSPTRSAFLSLVNSDGPPTWTVS